MQVPEEIKRAQVFVEKHLRKFFREKIKSAHTIDQFCEVLVEQIANFSLRPAKRIRPFLVWLGSQVKSQESRVKSDKTKIPANFTHAMMAVELFHTFALIHDDIMDEDVVRRGGPAVHEFFRINALTHQRINSRNAVHFGQSMAILAGDLALVWADECMNKTQNHRAIALFSKMKEEVAFGQVLDVMKQGGYQHISQEKTNELKTAWYTIVRPLQIGAALAGASETTLSALAAYGVPVGSLFQLKDDLMDQEITQNELNRQVSQLQPEVRRALDGLKLPPKTKDLFRQLVLFVIERPS